MQKLSLGLSVLPIVSMMFLFSGCANNEFAEIPNTPVSYTFDKADKYTFMFDQYSGICVNYCNTSTRGYASQHFVCQDNLCKIVYQYQLDSGLFSKLTEIYNIQREELAEGDNLTVKFTPLKKEISKVKISFADQVESNINPQCYLAKSRIELNYNKEILTSNSQTVIMGNFNRFGVTDQENANNASNEIRIKMTLEDGSTISSRVQAFTAKNGTIVRINNLQFDFLGCVTERNIKQYTENFVSQITKMIND